MRIWKTRHNALNCYIQWHPCRYYVICKFSACTMLLKISNSGAIGEAAVVVGVRAVGIVVEAVGVVAIKVTDLVGRSLFMAERPMLSKNPKSGRGRSCCRDLQHPMFSKYSKCEGGCWWYFRDPKPPSGKAESE